ncbi:MAG: LemA family protein, partial [Candidatus Faecivicinus sp.]
AVSPYHCKEEKTIWQSSSQSPLFFCFRCQFYNDTVLRYDRLLETVPTNLIAKMFHFQKEEFFKVEESEKAKVTVRF